MPADIQQAVNAIHSVYAIVADVFVMTLVVIAIIFVVRILRDSSYTIRQINVPPPFDEAGHSGSVIAKRIHAKLSEIIQQVSATEYARGYTTTAGDSDVSVDVAGMGMPIKGFIELIGITLGIKRNKKIDADIFIEGSHVVMLLRVTGENPERFDVPAHENIGIPVKELILRASESILKYSNDEALQTYFGHLVRNGEKAAKLAKYRLDKYKGNRHMEARMVSAWARGLCMMKKYDEAVEKIKEGILLNNKEGRLYNVWGMTLQEQGKHEEAKAKFMMAVNLMRSKESKFRRSNVLTAIGVCSAKLGQSDAAMDYYTQAIAVDENAHLSYYHLAKEYLVKKNMLLFFEILEKSLSKGLTAQHVTQDPDLQGMLTDPQLKRLLEKYAED
jgi:hypothetical protein